jgi:hypothetical protein
VRAVSAIGSEEEPVIPNQSPPVADSSTAPGADDPLAEIDRLMKDQVDDEQRASDRSAQIEAGRSEFSTEVSRVCDQQVRPQMEAVLERLRRNGGGGLIEERPEDLTRHHTHRLTLWMSLHGEITGSPRQDRHPYLQLDADVEARLVTISEGDMWQGHGGNRSGRVDARPLAEITGSLITQEALAILHRSTR